MRQTKDGNDPDISVLNLNVEKCCKGIIHTGFGGETFVESGGLKFYSGIKDEKEVRGLKKKVDLLNEKNRTLEIRNQKDQTDLERIKNEKSELTKSLTRYQERIDKGKCTNWDGHLIVAIPLMPSTAEDVNNSI